MKYRRLLRTGLLTYCATGLIGQTSREAYRQAFDVWQQAQANLERDAGSAGTALVSQADRAAAAAVTFEATRAAYLKSSAQDAAQRRQFLQTKAARPSPDLAPPAVAELAATELQMVTRTIARFANDPDRGIQQLRQSLERERVALVALTDTIQTRQKMVAAASATADALEQARTKTAETFSDQTSQISQAVAQSEIEGAAWSQYYEKLTQAIQAASAPPAPRVDITPVATRNTSISPIPLPRYVGAWTYPTVNGIFHGAQPEFVDLVVHEQDGHADGTLFARFKQSSGSATDPLVRFDFQGDFAATPVQRFKLVTSDGAQGTVELIPGPAFNLLEVNFQTDPQANKIRTGNFILVKK
ncbi:MAG: hypothetical protein LAO55_24275 [Acidobacteriia bacterium]|nr:hypothetical protein [Terriglobia bacterium]